MQRRMKPIAIGGIPRWRAGGIDAHEAHDQVLHPTDAER
jgi:hypothetical protein